MVIFLMVILPVSISLQSCEEILPIIEEILNTFMTGWDGKEDYNEIPEDITPFDGDPSGFKKRISLDGLYDVDGVPNSNRFPPIGDQGSYGTCVAWAVGYNLRTALNAIENGWSSSQLASTANQVSPKDLWWIIPSSKKGTKCNGTNFEPALDAIIKDGVATLSTVPYKDLGSCTGTGGGNTDNKLANYRKIASDTDKNSLNPDNFKGYLNAGRPIAIGAKLGERFMTWKGSSVINDDTDTYKGQHAYHAMALVGYDDSKNAFRVRNSWGTSWGDNGSIWVDYDFFCNKFCFAAFVAQNPTNVSLGSPTPTTGTDLAAYYAVDFDYDPDDFEDECEACTRTFFYDVYNSGTTTIYPSQKWTVTYLYYNAFNANNYGIIYDDYFTDEFGGVEGDIEENPNSNAIAGGYMNHFTVYQGENVGVYVNEDGEERNYIIGYNMPKITGKYYLVVMADAYDVIKEVNEDNNFYFITADNGKPLEFKNGVIQNLPKSSMQRSSVIKRPGLFANTDHQTPVVPGNLNAYTPAEIQTMLIHDKKNGRLDAKRKAFSVENQNGKKHVRSVRKIQE